MTIVRIVRTDGKERSVIQYPLREVCRSVRLDGFWRDGFYQVAFVEPVPLFDVVTYRVAHPIPRTVLNSRVPLTVALALALAERAADESSGNGRKWRTVVRPAR